MKRNLLIIGTAICFLAGTILLLFTPTVRDTNSFRAAGDLPAISLPAPLSEVLISEQSVLQRDTQTDLKTELATTAAIDIFEVIGRAHGGTSGPRETYLAKLAIYNCLSYQKVYGSIRTGLDEQIQQLKRDDPLREKKINLIQREFSVCLEIEKKGKLIEFQEVIAKRGNTIDAADSRLQGLLASQPNSYFTSSSISKLCDILIQSQTMPEMLGDLSPFLVLLPRSTYLDFPRTLENEHLMRLATTLTECTLGSSNCAANGKWLNSICVIEGECSIQSFRQHLLKNRSSEDKQVVLIMETKLINSIKNRDCKAVGLYQ